MKTCIPFYWMIEGGGHSHKFTLIHPCMRESSTKPHVSLVSGILLFLRYQHVASFSKRMESTGRTSRVRVTAHCPPFLRDPTDSLYRSIWGGSGLGYADQLIGGPLTGGMPLDRRQSYGRHDASGTASPDCRNVQGWWWFWGSMVHIFQSHGVSGYVFVPPKQNGGRFRCVENRRRFRTKRKPPWEEGCKALESNRP